MVEEIQENEFTEKVLKTSEYVVVDFYADWCGPCKMMAPVLDAAANEVKAKFFKINVDQAPNVARQFSVMSIPTFIVFKDRQAVGQLAGYMSKEVFIAKLKEVVK